VDLGESSLPSLRSILVGQRQQLRFHSKLHNVMDTLQIIALSSPPHDHATLCNALVRR
jgi:hypothetical protein